MTSLQDLVTEAVGDGIVPGAAALVAAGGAREVAAAGDIAADSIVRLASVTKPITAAAVMLLVDDGIVRLDDPVSRWLPELASPLVVRAPAGGLDDVVPAARAVTVEDVLTFRAGWGFPSDFSLPAVPQPFARPPVLAPPPRRGVVRRPPRLPPAADAGRVGRHAREHPDAPPPRGGVALQHMLRHPGRARRSRVGPCARRPPRRARLRAARHGRHG